MQSENDHCILTAGAFWRVGKLDERTIPLATNAIAILKRQCPNAVQMQDADARSSSDGSGDEVDQRRLQLYERSRLRYYYAVVDCKDVRTAAHLYTECDGIEFLRSACKLDMRFVPYEQV